MNINYRLQFKLFPTDAQRQHIEPKLGLNRWQFYHYCAGPYKTEPSCGYGNPWQERALRGGSSHKTVGGMLPSTYGPRFTTHEAFQCPHGQAATLPNGIAYILNKVRSLHCYIINIRDNSGVAQLKEMLTSSLKWQQLHWCTGGCQAEI